MLFFHKEEASLKSQKKYMTWLKNLFLMAIILRYLEEGIIYTMAGSQLEMNFEILLACKIKNLYSRNNYFINSIYFF